MKDTSDIGIMRPAICPECGYSLNKLPTEGACPECGWRFGAEQIVVFVWGKAGSTARSLIFMWIEIGGMVFACMPLAMFFLTFVSMRSVFPTSVLWRFFSRAEFWVMIVMMAIWVTTTWLGIVRRRRNLRMMPAPVQVRLSREGVAIREGLGQAKRRPWTKVRGFEFYRKKDGRQRIRIRWRGWVKVPSDLDTDLGDADAALVMHRVEEWRARGGEK